MLCNVGHGIQRFQGGAQSAAVAKLNFLLSPVRPTTWLWCKLAPLCGSVYQTQDTFFKPLLYIEKVAHKQVAVTKRGHLNTIGPFHRLSLLFVPSLNSDFLLPAESHLSLGVSLHVSAPVKDSAVTELPSLLFLLCLSSPEGSQLPLRN